MVYQKLYPLGTRFLMIRETNLNNGIYTTAVIEISQYKRGERRIMQQYYRVILPDGTLGREEFRLLDDYYILKLLHTNKDAGGVLSDLLEFLPCSGCPPEILHMPISDYRFTIPTRARNALIVYFYPSSVVTIENLIQKTEGELFDTPNLGKDSLQRIKEWLSQYGLRLGMTPKEIQRVVLDDAEEYVEQD